MPCCQSQLAWRREASPAEMLRVDFAAVVELCHHVGAEHHVAQLAEMIRVGRHGALRRAGTRQVKGQRALLTFLQFLFQFKQLKSKRG